MPPVPSAAEAPARRERIGNHRTAACSRRVFGVGAVVGIIVLGACDTSKAVSPLSGLSARENRLIDVPSAAPKDSTITIVPSGAPAVITVPTYDGSGEAVHPDVVTFPEAWNGHRFWSAVTPYRNSSIALENPSLLGSNDGMKWDAPASGLNPLVTTKRGHLSDPDMIFEPRSQQLWMYYREVQLASVKGKSVHVADRVWLTKSADAVAWSAPQLVVTDSARYAVSPSIVQDPNGTLRMYQVDAGTVGCSTKAARLVQRMSVDGIVWSAPSAVSFSQPGFVPWHLDVQYIASRGEYWALVAAYPPKSGCHRSNLYLATSRDGYNWTTYPRAVLTPGEFRQFSATVYRSTFSYSSNDSLTIWYSGAQQVRKGTKKSPAVFSWSLAVSHTTGQRLFARVTDKTGTAKLNVTTGSAGIPSSIVP